MATLTLQLLCSILFSISCLCSSLAQSRTYIIHMDSSSIPKPFSGHQSWYLATLSSISDNSEETPTTAASRLIYTYTSSIHGFSASLSLSELEALKSSTGYVSYTRDRPLKLHTTHTSQFLGLNSVSGIWPTSNYGQDVIIGLVDTGIWPESESFKDDGMTQIPSRWKGKCIAGTQFNASVCNKKLIGAGFYNKGLISNNPHLKISMKSPRDTSGHGTHTSSIAAGNYVKGASYFGYANGTARGMAPRARIAMYKAAWRYGVFSSDVLAAIDQAIQDGVDILSLSLGFALEDTFLEDDPIAIATFAAMKKGVLVVASAGNDGPLYGTVINGAPWVLTTGAGTIDREFDGVLSLGNGMQITFISLYPGSSSLRQLPLVFLDGCKSVEEMKKKRNKIVVCKDDLSISTQVENAEVARVYGAIFISNYSLSELYKRSSFPTAFIGLRDGQTVIDYIKKNSNPRGSLKYRKTVIGKKPAPMVDGYSSRGPFPSCPRVLKPDLLAPGSLILGSWSPSTSVAVLQSRPLYSNFNLESGTSMAAPHVAGVAALIKEVHPDWSPAAIRSALMTTASSLDNTFGPIKDKANNKLPASPLDIGAGHLNPNKALDPGLVYDATMEDYVKLLCAMNYTATKIKLITRSTHINCLNSSLDLNYPSFIAFFNDYDSSSDTKVVREFRRTVTNVREGRSSYSAKLTAMSGLKVKVEPEKLVFKQKYEKQSYKLSLEGPKVLQEVVIHGSLGWVDDLRHYVVRSPIVATSLVPDSLSKTKL